MNHTVVDQQPEAQPEAPQQDQPEAQPQLRFLIPAGTTHVDLSLEELETLLDQLEAFYLNAPRDELMTTILLAIKPIARLMLAGMAMKQRPGLPPVPRVQRGQDVNVVALRYMARLILLYVAKIYPTIDLGPLLAFQAWRRSQQQGQTQLPEPPEPQENQEGQSDG